MTVKDSDLDFGLTRKASRDRFTSEAPARGCLIQLRAA
jgi:hypothetical protein